MRFKTKDALASLSCNPILSSIYQDIRSNAPDVELDVDIPSDLLDNPTVIRLAQQLQTSENHRYIGTSFLTIELENYS